MNKKELEGNLERAFWVDKQLPANGLKQLNSALGRLVILPDGRPINDIFAEKRAHERPTREDLALWETAMFDWIPSLPPNLRDIIKRRCSGMGWKRIAYELDISIRTAQRWYNTGLDSLLKSI